MGQFLLVTGILFLLFDSIQRIDSYFILWESIKIVSNQFYLQNYSEYSKDDSGSRKNVLYIHFLVGNIETHQITENWAR